MSKENEVVGDNKKLDAKNTKSAPIAKSASNVSMDKSDKKPSNKSNPQGESPAANTKSINKAKLEKNDKVDSSKDKIVVERKSSQDQKNNTVHGDRKYNQPNNQLGNNVVVKSKNAVQKKEKQKIPTIGDQGTGKRKTSVARVILAPATDNKPAGIFINSKNYMEYFSRETNHMIIFQPLKLVEKVDQFHIIVNVHGGGESGQAGAIRHGISRALVLHDPLLKPVLAHAGFMTRDSRKVERKKLGFVKARKRKQFSKR